VYVQVDDVKAYLDKIGKLGGKTIVPPTDVPGMGQFAWFADVEGNVIGLWKAAPRNPGS
jgi:predicted enzyme related to lactoylglutathione lyase